MLNINIWNIAFTVINLLVLYIFMKHFLIGPVRKILDERKQMIERDLDDAKNTRTEAEQMKASYEVSMGKAEEGMNTTVSLPRPGKTLQRRWRMLIRPSPWKGRRP